MVTALLLLFAGPWLVYVFVRVPDELAEHRNYSQTAGIALFFALALESLPLPLMVMAVAALSAATHYRVSAYRSVVAFWQRAAESSSGDCSRAWQEIGAWEKVFGDAGRSETALREALASNPRLWPAMDNLGWLLYQKGNRTEGEYWLSEAMIRCPEWWEAAYKWGLILEQKGNTLGAWACYQKALRLTASVEAENRLGLIAFYAGRLGEALTRFSAALDLRPAHWEYVYNRAVTLRHLGNTEEAERILNALPQPVPVTGNMIRIEFSGGRGL